MHILDNTYEESTDETLIKILSEKSVRQILSLLQGRPITALEVVPKCSSSSSLVYSKIHQLENLNLLYVSGDISKNNKRKFYYQSKIKSFTLKFVNGETHLEIIYNKRFLDSTQ